MKRIIDFSVLLLIMMILYSCASLDRGTVRNSNTGYKYKPGVWHRVEIGQTLWRISKTYGVPLEVIKSVNEIDDVLHINPGTWIFIPGATKHLYVQGSLGDSNRNGRSFKISLPVKGEIVRKFGRIKKDFNYGIDIKVYGTRFVVSPYSGTVAYSGIVRGYGYVLIVDHGNGFYSLYTRDIEPVVKEGQKVSANTVIAKIVRNRGDSSTILHYELYYKGKPVNPLYYIDN